MSIRCVTAEKSIITKMLDMISTITNYWQTSHAIKCVIPGKLRLTNFNAKGPLLELLELFTIIHLRWGMHKLTLQPPPVDLSQKGVNIRYNALIKASSFTFRCPRSHFASCDDDSSPQSMSPSRRDTLSQPVIRLCDAGRAPSSGSHKQLSGRMSTFAMTLLQREFDQRMS